MGKSLVIVESKTKTKTIAKFLGKNFKVLASVGHIKDLPKNKLGIDIEDEFKPHYITIRGKGPVLSELKKTAESVDTVFLATDPDREGEAIAWHIANEIRPKNPNIKRVLFNEITKAGVLRGMANQHSIDENRVEAQKARRVLDRLVGYQVSPILWQTIYRGLSAGRVQSVALRLLCEREDLIDAFLIEEYWSITAQLQRQTSDKMLSKLVKLNQKAPQIDNEEQAKKLVAELKKSQYKVVKVKKKKITKNPAAPFTTSTLQQEASKQLRFSTKKTMMIAQGLYEGIDSGKDGQVGLITYMRTDSTRVADEAIQGVREHIYVDYGKEYLPEKPRVFTTKKTAQDAHEAIRPTGMTRSPKAIKKFLTDDQYKLYELIWKRFVASQMEAARIEQTSIDISAEPEVKSKNTYLFRSTGSVYLFRGFLQVYEEAKEESDEPEENQTLPKGVTEGEDLSLLDLISKQHFTKPPARFSESSLVKELDSLNIGRPSTYATIISTLLTRKYADRQGRQLTPTELGRTVNGILVQQFPDIFNVKFTAQMEDELDKIEAGDKRFLKVVGDFYQPFGIALKAADDKKDEIRESLMEDAGEACPQCQKPVVLRWGRNGKFLACSGYPDCKFTKPLEEPEPTGISCPNCGKEMVLKVGRYGRFLACSGYPDCKTTSPFRLGIPCPKEDCKGDVVERRSKRGRTFYGCSEYPDCNFVSWYKPINTKCPNCGHQYLEERYTQAKGEYLRCPSCKTEYEVDMTKV
ncbi:type I DNA topoisomerase [bacterium]|nr:type I DNA topoisomerase [bacterium]